MFDYIEYRILQKSKLEDNLRDAESQFNLNMDNEISCKKYLIIDVAIRDVETFNKYRVIEERLSRRTAGLYEQISNLKKILETYE